MLLKIIFLLAIFLSSPAFTAVRVGLFANPRCQLVLKRIDREYREQFMREAVEQGIFEPEMVDEYIARRIRIQLFTEEELDSQYELDFAGTVRDLVDERVAETLQITVEEVKRANIKGTRSDIIRALDIETTRSGLARAFAGLTDAAVLDRGGATYGELHPITSAFVNNKIPLTAKELELFDQTIRLSRLLKLHRGLTSMYLIEIRPLVHRDRIDPKFWMENLYWPVQHDLADNWRSYYGADDSFVPVLTAYANGNKPLDGAKAAKLEATLLSSSKVPRALKEEIQRERDFLDKFAFAVHPSYESFLQHIADYFQEA